MLNIILENYDWINYLSKNLKNNNKFLLKLIELDE